MVETDIVEKLGISHSPLREAFKNLQKDGLVVIVPRKGAFVKLITRNDIEENFPVRAVLEGLAAKQAYHRMSEENLIEMKNVLQKMEKAVRRDDVKTYRQHHIMFHNIFINASMNDLLINTLQSLRMHSLWFAFSYKYYTEDINSSLETHKKILELFEKRDLNDKEIENFVRNHIEVALEKFLAYLEGEKQLYDKFKKVEVDRDIKRSK